MEKCEQCGALICLECKKIHRVTHTTSSSSFDDDFHSSDSYTTRHILCPLCYYDMIETAGTKGRFFLLCPIAFMIIFIGVVIFMLSNLLDFIESWNRNGGSALPGLGPEIMLLVFPFFFIIPLAMCIFMIRQFFIVGPRTARQARADREAFLQEIGMERRFAPRDEFRSDTFTRSRKTHYCETCGSKMSAKDLYCLNCGSARK